MCGIAGIKVKNNKIKIQIPIKELTEFQNHRGPDDIGYWYSKKKNVALGHNRLSIIDLEKTSSQPMTFKEYTIVFNGEVYNYKNLKKILLKDKFKFKSNGDTEVLLYSFIKWGYKCLDHINGMFSFVIYDQKQDIFFCARDIIGEKPLYYLDTKDKFIFSSELPALVKVFNNELTINKAACGNFFNKNIRNIPSPCTIYNEISKLRPGHYMIKDNSSKKIKQIPYFKFTKNVNVIKNDISQSINLAKNSDVKLSVLLSGGIDSSLMAILLKKKFNVDINAYTIGSNENDPDIINAKKLSSILGINHKIIYFKKQNSFSRYKKLILAHGEPFALIPCLLFNDIFSEMKKDNLKVAIVGNGADEIFYGYDDIKKTLITNYLLNEKFSLLMKLLGKFNKKLYFLSQKIGKVKSNIIKYNHTSFQKKIINKKFINITLSEESNYWTRIFKPTNYIDEHYLLQLFLNHQHSLTLSSDLAGMQNSIEVRAPFLNKVILNKFLCKDWKKKVNFKNFLSYEKKYLLKQYLKEIIEEYNLNYYPIKEKRGLGYEIQEEKLFKNFWRKDLDRLFENFNDLNFYFNKKSFMKIWEDFKNNKNNETESISKMISIQILLQGH